jgi:hypothetical protein
MVLLFVRSCLAVAAFCARTSFVRDDVEDPIQLADIQAKGIMEGIVVRVDSAEAAWDVALIYWTSLEAVLGLLTQVLQWA